MKGKGSHPVGIFCVIFACLVVACFSPTLLSQSKSFSGQWISSLGMLTLTVSGSDASGTCSAGGASGTLEGKLARNGRLFTGRWKMDNREGRAVFRLLDDGNAFTGRWWSGTDRPGGDWIGVRANKEQAATAISAQNFSGRWLSNYGAMSLTVSELAVNGEFAGQRNRGTLRAELDRRTHKLIGNWADASHKGRFIFQLLQGGSGFLGEWWFEDGAYGGYWYGVRHADLDGCIAGNCEEGVGTYIWADGTRYEGEWKGGIYHGSGALYEPYGGVKTRGLWAEGVYQGECLSGNCSNGRGVLELPNGDQYEGNFVECIEEGKGIYQYRNGDRYEGEFKAAFPHGSGTHAWAVSGDKYTGKFARGKIQGQGSYYFKNGDVYEGNFRRGERYGQGTMRWANGDRYEGNWESDRMSGAGAYFYKDGDSYSGEFRNGLKHGQGSYTFSNGNSFLALWKEDRIDRFDSSSSGYGGLAEQSGSPTLPVTIANQSPGSLSSTRGEARESTFLIYKVTEKSLPGVKTGEEIREVYFTYSIVQGLAELDEAAVRAFLQSQSGSPLGSEYRVEKVSDPNLRANQILRRYRLGSASTRINSGFEGYFYVYED